MLKAEQYYPKDVKRLKQLAFILISLGILFYVYKEFFFGFASYKYTVATVSGKYNDSKSFGITYIYDVDGKDLTATCINGDCRELPMGTRCIVRYYADRPSWTMLFPEFIVPKSITPPSEGWNEIPKSITKSQ